MCVNFWEAVSRCLRWRNPHLLGFHRTATQIETGKDSMMDFTKELSTPSSKILGMELVDLSSLQGARIKVDFPGIRWTGGENSSIRLVD